MATGLLEQHFGDERDPAANAPGAVTDTASSAGAPANGSQLRFASRSFDPATDKDVHLSFWLPTTYIGGGTLNIMWLSTGTTNNVIWKTAFVLIHPSSEGAPTDLDAAAFGTVTAQPAVAVPSTAGQVKQTSLNLGLSGAHAGDNLRVMFGRDAGAAGDTSTAAALWLDPWTLTFTTT